MAKAKNFKNTETSPSPFNFLISVPTFTSLLFLPTKNTRKQNHSSSCTSSSTLLLLSLFFTIASLSLLLLLHSIPISENFNSLSPTSSPLELASFSTLLSSDNVDDHNDKPKLSTSVIMPLPIRGLSRNFSEKEREFWKQPEREDYVPCLEFGIEYRKASAKISKEKRRFLMVVVSGGLNQQKVQIVDAVVIARILEASLVVPVLQVNMIWGDDSEFSDIFDVEHFKKTLQADVRVVSSLPSTHRVSKQSVESEIPFNVSPGWIRAKFFKKINEGVLILKGLDSKLSKNLPPDLQKLRCKVAFHALKFVAPIQELGNRLAKRMWIEGPYIAIHLRLEKDVWIRTGCLTGLGPTYDKIIIHYRKSNPEFLTGRLNLTSNQRRLAGLCPLNALEIARFLKALGAPSSARIYYAGGGPFGGARALQPLKAEFSNLVTKEMLARDGELSPFLNKSSALAAIDYIVSLSSDVSIPSHGGNMAKLLQGHRAYVGHRKFIKPNKRAILPLFEDAMISEAELGTVIRKLHGRSQGQPELRTNKRDRDVLAYPVPECMCRGCRRIF
ncbi:GDP-fucose protein O-fucosyltransferase [Dillenia turbinata]|uniref:O-fucosyltransferase family protein n=1 Tax=Dillenia turbinata TaxID=194707 RepID=A0AAN8V370_9MAGN